MEKDVLVIRPEAPPASGWKPITISVEAYNSIKEIAEETGLSISKVACIILDFGIERVVIEKQTKEV